MQQRMFREAAARQQAVRSQQAAAAAAAGAPVVAASFAYAADAPDPPLGELVAQVLRDRADPSRCLGLPPDAPAERVRKRYLQLAKRLHPDKSIDARAPEAFAALEHAYGVLAR
jgi:hypothetical protein